MFWSCLLMSQRRSMGLRSGEWGGRKIGSNRPQFNDLLLCQEALSKMSTLRGRSSWISRLAWSRKIWKISLSEWLNSSANNSPGLGKTMPVTFIFRYAPQYDWRILSPFFAKRLFGRGSPSTPHSSKNLRSTPWSPINFLISSMKAFLFSSSWPSAKI